MLEKSTQKGFTLIEMMVSIALFSVVMLIATTSLLALVDANRKAQALHSVMENLNIATDGMVRSIRMGTTYHCGSAGIMTEPRNCTNNGSDLIAFEPYGGNKDLSGDQRVYWFGTDENGIGRLYLSLDGGATGYPVTAPEVDLERVRFYVSGAQESGVRQPRVVIVLSGIANNVKLKTQTSFTVQTAASQRSLDI